MPGPFAATLACAVLIASPALAAPFTTVDGTAKYISMLDEGTLVRSNGGVEAEALLVTSSSARLVKFRFDCAARTWRLVSKRSVGADMTLSAPTMVDEPAAAAQPGSLGASLLERACFGRLVNASGGGSTPTLGEAIVDARAILVRANSQP